VTDCLFCSIANHELDAAIRFESENVVAFEDINPAAPVHLLVIPKSHIGSADELEGSDPALLSEIFRVVRDLAREAGLGQGYRVVTNVGSEGGQTVGHLHFHLIGGRQMSWPPG
jgi:histidine triad (HIT) family protein